MKKKRTGEKISEKLIVEKYFIIMDHLFYVRFKYNKYTYILNTITETNNNLKLLHKRTLNHIKIKPCVAQLKPPLRSYLKTILLSVSSKTLQVTDI